jgi:hypothetical protein
MPRNSKYGAVPQMVDNLRFGSKREAGRYEDLRLLQRIGKIEKLEAAKGNLRYDLAVNGILICRYEADFRYFDLEVGKWVVEDSKGFRTPAYRIKRKLMKACHDIEIREV